MDTTVMILMAVVCAIVTIYIIYIGVRIYTTPVDQRKELIINYLIGLVTAAEEFYTEHGKGSEKFKQVEQEFKAKAPWSLKILLLVTDATDLDELIELALQKAKAIWSQT